MILYARRLVEPGPISRGSPVAYLSFPVEPADKDVWRKITVEVSPGMMRFTVLNHSQGSWQIVESGPGTQERLDKARNAVCGPSKVVPAQPGLPIPLEVHPEYAPRSPMGLFIYRGLASFRNVVITPLPTEN